MSDDSTMRMVRAACATEALVGELVGAPRPAPKVQFSMSIEIVGDLAALCRWAYERMTTPAGRAVDAARLRADAADRLFEADERFGRDEAGP